MKELFFDKAYLKESTGIKWWAKILLFFCKSYMGIDVGKDYKSIVTTKRLFGKIYLTDCKLEEVSYD